METKSADHTKLKTLVMIGINFRRFLIDCAKNYRMSYGIILLAILTGWLSNVYSQNLQKAAGIDSTYIFSIVEHDGSLYAAGFSRIFKSTDNGDTWQPATAQPGNYKYINTLFPYKEYIYAGTDSNGVYRSNDGGVNWYVFNSGIPANSADIVGFTALGDSLYAGTNNSGIYVINISTSTSWSAYNTGLFQFGTNSIGVSGNNIVASVGYYLFKRARNSASWTDVFFDSNGIQRFVYETLVMDEHLFSGTDNGVYRGTLDAQNWEHVDIRAFPSRDIVALAAHGSRIFAGLLYQGQYWIFSSDNMGITWEIRAHEFAYLFDLFVSGNHLWAGRDDGLWYFDLVMTDIKEPEDNIPNVLELSQNYPNPFNPTTSIEYEVYLDSPRQVLRSENVSLKIYDILGNEIKTLVNEVQEPGSYKVEFDGIELSSGIYICHLKVNTFSKFIKMLLLK